MRTALFILCMLLTPMLARSADPPKGVESAGFYEVKVTTLTPQVITYLNKEPFKERDAFILRIKNPTNTELTKLKQLPWVKKLYLASVKEPVDLSALTPLKQLHTLQVSPATHATNFTSLSALPALHTLDFQGGKLGDIAFLKELPKLKSLTLHNITTIKDYSPLSALTGLVNLSVAGHRKDDKALAPIGGLIHLETLGLGRYTGSSLGFIANCKKLRKLDLIFSKSVTDISTVKNFPDLEELNLWGSMVTDLAPLSGLKKLKTLNIRDTKVTNIQPLLTLKSLKHISLPKSLSEADLQKVKKALPNAHIG